MRHRFRAWADGKIHYLEHEMYWFFGDSGYWSLNTTWDDGIVCDSLESKNPVLMQYTGLYDKNGTEIYEGDILRCARRDMDYSDTVAVKYTPGEFVVYNPNCCEVCKNGDGCIECLTDRVFFDSLRDIQVIGNLHENPELMEAE